MPRTKQTARKSTGGEAPRLDFASDDDISADDKGSCAVNGRDPHAQPPAQRSMRTKQTARKSTGGEAPRRQYTGVDEGKAAVRKKGAPSKPSKPNQKYVVISSSGYRPDGFHASMEPETEVVSVHDSLEGANEAAELHFYQDNPWGWVQEDFERNCGVEHDTRDGCAVLSVEPEDSERWEVSVKKSRK